MRTCLFIQSIKDASTSLLVVGVSIHVCVLCLSRIVSRHEYKQGWLNTFYVYFTYEYVNHYSKLQMRITILGYADMNNKRIYIPFISNIYILYFYVYFTSERVIFRQFIFFML
jgi:hypothetical protein